MPSSPRFGSLYVFYVWMHGWLSSGGASSLMFARPYQKVVFAGSALVRLLPRKVLVAVLAAAALVTSSGAQAAAHHGRERADTQSLEVIMLSDLHVDPFADPARLPRLRAAGAKDWDAILAAPPSATAADDFARLNAACGLRNADSTPALLNSSLRAAHAAAPRATFVVVAGDLLAHDFDCRFKALAPGATEVDYSQFAARMAAYVALALRQTFGATPVYLALGNNDSGCGDYRETPGSPFLRALAASLAGEFTAGRAIAGASPQFASDGSYTVQLPAPAVRGRLIVLDDLFLSRAYKTCAGQPDSAAPQAQLDWLRTQLDHARAAREQVWVLAHIPPGVDVYSTVRAKGPLCDSVQPDTLQVQPGRQPIMFLAGEQLNEVLTDYGDIVRLALFGHTHNDEIHLLQPDLTSPGTQAVAAKLLPSITPINGNQPAFTVAQIEPRSLVLEDYRVFMADNSTGIGTRWAEEYRFQTLYGVRGYTPAHVRTLLDAFIADKPGAAQASTDYAQKFFPGGGKGTLGVHLVWPQYACATENHTAESYRTCVCPTP